MDQQRHRAGGRRRRRKTRSAEPRQVAEPILIAARRPNAPRVARSAPAGSAAPRSAPVAVLAEEIAKERPPEPEPVPRRAARIVQVVKSDADDRERQRQRLFDRLMGAETRGSISRAADEYVQAGFEFPVEQPVQLQLLEHFDETRARDAIRALAELFAKESPLKRPILEQRLRRLEEYADEAATRDAAAELRRALRA